MNDFQNLFTTHSSTHFWHKHKMNLICNLFIIGWTLPTKRSEPQNPNCNWDDIFWVNFFTVECLYLKLKVVDIQLSPPQLNITVEDKNCFPLFLLSPDPTPVWQSKSSVGASAVPSSYSSSPSSDGEHSDIIITANLVHVSAFFWNAKVYQSIGRFM